MVTARALDFPLLVFAFSRGGLSLSYEGRWWQQHAPSASQPPALLDDDDWLAPPLEAALGEVFCRFDADADGAWSTAELQSFARTCNGGDEFGEAELSQVGEFTTDGHGRLTRRGFLEMMHLQTMARPEDTWADLRALGYDSSLSPKGVPGSSGAEAAPSEKPESVAAARDSRS